MEKFVYSYDPVTKEYAGAVQCCLCPITKTDWIVPADTTHIAPPDTENGFCAVFDGAAWIITPDLRGQPIYDTENGEEIGVVQILDFELQDNQTLDTPIVSPKGYKTVWENSAWVSKEDHRGEVIYSTINGDEILIETLGSYPENTTHHPRPDGYHMWDGQEWVFDPQHLWVVVREQRDALLRESDWIELSRRLTPEQKQAWIDYRDALFDLPDTQSDAQTLADIIWPTPPNV